MDQLPLDLIDRILTSLPDFDTLCATILVSKSIYNVFKIRPTSIKASVTFNIAGPSAKQAMALSNIQWDRTVEFYEEANIKDYPSCRVQGTQLLDRANIVASFEALFSRRYKDRESATSALSASESLRFQRALYRLWSYQAIFGEDWDETNDSSEDEEIEEMLHKSRKFIDVIGDSVQEREFAAVCRFMMEINHWLWVNKNPLIWTSPNSSKFLSTSTPDIIWRCIESGRDLGIFEQDLWATSSFLAKDLLEVPLDIMELDTAEPCAKAILEEWDATKHACSHCHNDGLEDLWNEKNWDLLSGIILPSDLIDLLEGRLRSNVIEMPEIYKVVRVTYFDYADMLRKMFDAVRDEGDDDDDEWRPEAWLCTNCVKTFIKLNLRSWWLRYKQEHGLPLQQQDCWYGYNCRTQTHRHVHASRLNHFCVPTRGTE
ncbi:uncharacterized protein STEHIDRAFT_123904 [Stereum hirsutum FP-91666 SS1]|uniref:uncharacterized protein n=1 Tax=Stereum hirsutum (strain FP-91666) TaxID=721885 RepID=UPI0004449632|nr:uncharacterized protein STEHIDRAFT_123904 [Stereum hirsutum FP-91666 SS1]EIM83488.1 hypothetical protein STEHIDRAFT_123904 [Stereum hirsutum FP-91666 SS1]